jgi:hypothetical protein
MESTEISNLNKYQFFSSYFLTLYKDLSKRVKKVIYIFM